MKKVWFSILFLVLTAVFLIHYGVRSFDYSEPRDSSTIMDKKLYPYEGMYLARNYPYKSSGINAKEEAIRAALKQVKVSKRSAGEWEVQGPGNIGARINTIAISPFDDNIIFVGFSTGGVWRSQNGGVSWDPVFDDQVFSSIGDITFHPNEPNTVYVGTGDPNIGGYFFIGDGIYVSKDLGNTWSNLGLKDTRIISSINIDKTNPDVIYVSAMGPPYERNNDRGIFKSVDAGNTWEQVLLIDNQTGVTEVIIHPNNSNILYASAWTRIRNHKESLLNSDKAGVYRSKDAGNTWEKLENGLPGFATSRVGIAQAQNDPNILYALTVGAGNQNPEGLYKTEDGGDSWVKWNINRNEFSSALGGFGWYFGKIEIDPINTNKVYLLGVNLWSIEKQDTFRMTLEAPNWTTYEVHADKHDMVFHNNKVYLATDGGLYRSEVINNAAFQWQDIENIPTTQFYRVAYNLHNPDFYVGGAQDNGTTGGNKNTINLWERIRGGDGFQPAFYKNNDQVWFAESQRGNITYSEDAGFNWTVANNGLGGSRHWDMQYIVSPHEDEVLYTATDQVYTSRNGLPPLWFPISDTIVDLNRDAFIHQATSIDQSLLDINILYTGTSDGLVWRSIDEGQSWDHVTDGLPERYVSSIKASPNVVANAYVTFSGYRDGDYTPKIYKSEDFGSSWIPINGNLPNLAINDVYIYPYREGDEIIFVGTDAGVYFTINSGDTWERLGSNMSNIAVFDMDYNVAYNQIIAATYGRSIMTFDLDQVNIRKDISNTNTVDFLDIKVYPNPTIDYVNVLNYGQALSGVLFDKWGNILKKFEILRGNNRLDLSDLPPAIYYYRIGKKVGKISLIS